MADVSGKDDAVPFLIDAIRRAESGGSADPDVTSSQGAKGDMQITPATFRDYARPGESFDNPADREAAAVRKIRADYAYYGGDPHKTAAAYLGGGGAVLADGRIRYDVADANGTTPLAYAEKVVGSPAPQGQDSPYFNVPTGDKAGAFKADGIDSPYFDITKDTERLDLTPPAPVASTKKTTLTEDLKATGSNFVSNLASLGRMAGETGQALSDKGSLSEQIGKDMATYFGGIEQAWKPKEANRGIGGELLVGAGGASGMVAPAVVAGLAETPGILVAGGLGLLFGGSSYTEKSAQVKAAGGSDEDAKNAGLMSAAVNGVGLTAVSMLTGGAGQYIAKAFEGVEPTMGGVIKSLSDNGFMKPFVRGVATRLAGDTAIFESQGFANREIDKSYGLPTQSVSGAAKDALKSAIEFTIAGAPMAALEAHGISSQKSQIGKALSDPKADPAERLQAVMATANVAKSAGVPEDDIREWAMGAAHAVTDQIPITAYMRAPVPESEPPAESAPRALPPPGPITVDSEGNAATPEQAVHAAARADELGLTPDVQNVARAQRAREASMGAPVEPPLALPAPTDVLHATEAGEVGTAGQVQNAALARRLGADREAQRNAELGLTPDIQRLLASKSADVGQVMAAPTVEDAAAAAEQVANNGGAPLGNHVPMRSTPIPKEASLPISAFRNADDLKALPGYQEGKSGDVQAAVQLVRHAVTPQNIDEARQRFGQGAIYVAPMATEKAGHNAIPDALAMHYANETGGMVSDKIHQVNRAGHTGADPMERLLAKPVFEGPVQAGGKYVLVDDVTTLGGTLAELGHHIQANGGHIVGVVTLANAGRDDKLSAPKHVTREIERRYGDEVRQRFGIYPAALTSNEAGYLIGFKHADELRARAAKAGAGQSHGPTEAALPERQGGVTQPQSSETPAKAGASVSAPKNRPIKSTPLQDERLQNPHVREELGRMAGEAGWSEKGGRLIRGQDGQVSGRTKWIPKAERYGAGMGNEAFVRTAVDKALNGEPLNSAQKRTVSSMLAYIHDVMLPHLDALPTEDLAQAGILDNTPEEVKTSEDALSEAEEAHFRGLHEQFQNTLEALSGREMTDAEVNALFGFGDDDVQQTQGINAETQPGEPREGSQSSAGSAETPTVQADEFKLDHPTESSLSAREQAIAEENAHLERERAAADQRAQADAARSNFSLTGSDRAADVLEQQHGQKSLLDQESPLEERHAALDPRVDALTDDQAVSVGKALGIEYKRGEDIRQKIKQAHPDDQERALEAVKHDNAAEGGVLFSRGGSDESKLQRSVNDFWIRYFTVEQGRGGMRLRNPIRDEPSLVSALGGDDRAGSARSGAVIEGSGATAAILWGEKIAGQHGFVTAAAEHEGRFVMDVVPASLYYKSTDLPDLSIAHFSFKLLSDGSYELGVGGPERGSSAYKLLAESGNVKDTGQFSRSGREYLRTLLDTKYTESVALISEAIRRLSLEIGEAPTVVIPGRDTGANPGARGIVLSPEKYAAKLSRSGAHDQKSKIDDIHAELKKSLGKAWDAMVRRGEAGQPGGIVVAKTEEDALERLAQVRVQRGLASSVQEGVRQLSEIPHEIGIDAPAGFGGIHDRATGMSALVADQLRPKYVRGVVAHEIGVHAVPDTQLDQRAMEMFKLQAHTPFMRQVADRLRNAGLLDEEGRPTNPEEARAYITEEAIVQGRQAGHSVLDSGFWGWADKVLPAPVVDWLKNAVAWARSALYKAGYLVAAPKMSVDDLVAIARANVRQVGRNGIESNADRFHSVRDAFERHGYSIEIDPIEREIEYTDPEGEPVDFSELPEELQAIVNQHGDMALFSRSAGNFDPDIQSLNDNVLKHDGIKDAFKTSELGDPSIIDAFKKVFGVDIVPFEINNPDASGFLAMQYGGKLYVNADNGKHGFVQLAGHELLHQIRKDVPSLYDWFSERASDYLKEGAEAHYGERLKAAGADQARTDAREEMLADFAGDSLGDVVFLRSLAADNPGKFRMLLQSVVNWLKRVGDKLTGAGFGSSKYFKDVKGLQGYLAGVFDAYKASGWIPDHDLPMARRADSPSWAATPEEAEAARKAGAWAPEETLQEKLDEIRADWGDKAVQKVFDQFAPLKKLGLKPYILARLASGNDSLLEATLRHGTPYINSAGAANVRPDGKGFVGIMQDIGDDPSRFMSWIVGNRAQRILERSRLAQQQVESLTAKLRDLRSQMGQAENTGDLPRYKELKAQHDDVYREREEAKDRAGVTERNLSQKQIDYLKGLNQGTLKDGRSRADAYQKGLEAFNRYQKAVLDLAESSGVINHESRKMWESEFYVPFYRVADEDAQVKGPKPNLSGLVNAKGIRRLKGGAEALNDPLANTLLNWNHLFNASLRNRAATEALTETQKLGAADQVPSGTKGSIYVLKDGKEVHYEVSDPYILEAVTALSPAPVTGWPMKMMSKFKHYLTVGTTAAPAFRIAHTLREQLTAVAANPTTYNIMGNWVNGLKLSSKDGALRPQMLAGGSFMLLGGHGERGIEVAKLIRDGIGEDQILNTRDKVQDALGGVWKWWKEVGERSDEITRANLYKQIYDRTIAEGGTEDEAHLMGAYHARDVMDFGLRGTSDTLRFLTGAVPFMNARIQGLYKLGRGAVEDPKRFAIVMGAVTMATIALSISNQDDKDIQALPEYVRDSYWAFRIPGYDKVFLLPKPFEVGAMATIADRGFEALRNGMTPADQKRFIGRLLPILGSQLDLNPIPQMMRPGVELWANKDFFRGAPIETDSQQQRMVEDRVNPETSFLAKELGKAGVLSPVQIDHLINAYFGWLGTSIATAASVAAGKLSGQPDSPAWRADDIPVTGRFVRDLPNDNSRFLTEFYDQQKQIAQIMGSIKQRMEVGDVEGAKDLIEQHRNEIALKNDYGNTSMSLTKLNSRIRMLEDSDLPPDEKREKINALIQTRNNLARQMRETAVKAGAP